MKVIYFVRHGESEGNAGDTYQLDSSTLSNKGLNQAEQIAERALHLPIKSLVSSTMPRAVETATVISKKIQLPLVTSELFVERRRPSGQQGLIRTSPEAIEMDNGIIRSASEVGYRYADEENFDDLTLRAEKALSYLAQHASDNILVVTHGVFLRVLLAKAIYGNALTGKECTNIIGTMQTTNTGLTIFTYDTEKTPIWQVITWNDHAHLG